MKHIKYILSIFTFIYTIDLAIGLDKDMDDPTSVFSRNFVRDPWVDFSALEKIFSQGIMPSQSISPSHKSVYTKHFLNEKTGECYSYISPTLHKIEQIDKQDLILPMHLFKVNSLCCKSNEESPISHFHFHIVRKENSLDDFKLRHVFIIQFKSIKLWENIDKKTQNYVNAASRAALGPWATHYQSPTNIVFSDEEKEFYRDIVNSTFRAYKLKPHIPPYTRAVSTSDLLKVKGINPDNTEVVSTSPEPSPRKSPSPKTKRKRSIPKLESIASSFPETNSEATSPGTTMKKEKIKKKEKKERKKEKENNHNRRQRSNTFSS